MGGFVHLAPDVYRLAVPFPGWGRRCAGARKREHSDRFRGCAETVDSSIVPALERLGLSLKDIGWLVFTHIHGDHVAAAAAEDWRPI